MVKKKKMLVREKKELLDKLLKLQEDETRLKGQFNRLYARDERLRERRLAAAQALNAGLYANGEDGSQPIVYKGHVIKVNNSGATVESVKKVR